MISNIQRESDAVIGSMLSSLAGVEESMGLANEAGAAIGQIKSGAEKVVQSFSLEIDSKSKH